MSAVGSSTTHARPGAVPGSDGESSMSRQYSPDATILLVGFFGAGKKTVGIIASVALRRRFVDFDAVFFRETKSSPEQFIARHGLGKYREIELAISQDLLTTFPTNAVIVGLGRTASHPQQMLLVDFARRHPVIYVRRDEDDLRQFIATSPEKFDRIFTVGNEFFETCSNFDFFNHTQGQSHRTDRAVPSYLKLKETESVFVAFLHGIFGQRHPRVFSAEPFSVSNTYALSVPLKWMEDSTRDLQLLETGADAIALVVNPDEIQSPGSIGRLSRHMATLRMHSRVPIIVDVLASPVVRLGSEIYTQALQTLLRLAPDALTLSLECGDQAISQIVALKGRTKLIGTVHEASPVGSTRGSLDCVTIAQRARSCHVDAIRVTGEAFSPSDNLSCVSFIREMTEISNLPVIAYNTGALGRSSLILNPTLSPVALPQTTSTDGITISEAQTALTSCFLLQKRVFTIIGKSVEQSLSPAMHNLAYEACGLPHKHDIFQTENISDVNKLFANAMQGGVVVSLPYKTAILPFLDEISPDAKDINAVNTVVLEDRHQANGEQGIVRKGYNTDYIGIRDCIDKNLSPANTVSAGSTALIIGAGGMARAAIYACYELGIRSIGIYNRTRENAQTLADYYHQWTPSKPGVKLQVQVLGLDDAWPADLRPPTVIVSCLPPYQLDTGRSIPLQIPEQWLGSRTGGVFVEVCHLARKIWDVTNWTQGWVWCIEHAADGADAGAGGQGVGGG